MAKITYGTQQFEIPEGLTAQQAMEGLKGGMPELANAKLKPVGKTGDFTAEVDYGRKG